MKPIDIDQFCNDVSQSTALTNAQGTVNDLTDRYTKYMHQDTLRV